MRTTSEPFIRRPVMTLLLTASAILFGVLAYFTLPVNDLPAVDYPVIQVTVVYPGANPETVANNVATPLERQFMQIPGLDLITSKSNQGIAILTLQFSLSKSIDAAATDVQTAISQASGMLPPDLPSPPTFTKTNPNDQPILYIALSSDTITAGELYDMASTQAGQRISIIQGVSRYVVYGSKSAIRIKADPSALASRGMTMDDLAAAIQQGTSYRSAGQFDGPNRTFILQPQGQLDSAEKYNQLIIARREGNAPIFLKDVAQAIDSVQDERVKMRFFVRGHTVPSATVVLAVFRQAGANAVEVADAVKALLPTVSTQLPPSVTITPIYDRSRTIVNSVNDVKETLLIAFILVVIVIFVFLGRATDTLIPTVALPLSLLITFIAMKILGYSLDNLSLMALTLAIGFLVDDAIVFLENTVRRMETFEEGPLTASLNSAKEISFTIVSMTLSLAAVFLPLVFMSGLIGRIFREFAVTIVVSIIASGVVSLTLTPLMCARLLKGRGRGAKKTLMERIFGAFEKRVLGVYGRSLWFFLRHKWISAILFIGCLGGTIYLFTVVPRSFLPVGDSGFMMGVMGAQAGTAPEKMREYQIIADKLMQSNPAVEVTFSVTGLSAFFQPNQAFLLAFLKDKKERDPIQKVAMEVGGEVMGAIPGTYAVLNPQPILQLSTGATQNFQGQFSYTISGLNANEVYATSGKMMAKLMEYPGFASVNSDLFLNAPGLRIDILRERANMYGISATRIETQLRNAYSENYVYLIKKPDDQYQVILQTTNDTRREPEDLQKLYVRSDDGKTLVPFSAVATWKPQLGPQSVNHTNQFTSVTISFNLKPGSPIGNATDFIETAAKEIIPANLRGQFQGEAMTFKETMSSLTILMVLAVFVMYVILGILYESFIHPITVLSTLPTAMVGGLATLYLFGEEASLYAFIGLFMLMGIVKKNGIMIVDFAVHRVNQGEKAEQAIHDASMDRFRPIVMTTLAAVMGAVPIALGWGTDGGTRRPLGLVIVGGLLVSQLITLYVTPVIYLYMELFQEKILGTFSFLKTPDETARRAGELVKVESGEDNGANGNGH